MLLASIRFENCFRWAERMEDYNRSSFPIVLWRDKNLIVALSFVDSVRKFDLNEIVLEFLLSANASF